MIKLISTVYPHLPLNSFYLNVQMMLWQKSYLKWSIWIQTSVEIGEGAKRKQPNTLTVKAQAMYGWDFWSCSNCCSAVFSEIISTSMKDKHRVCLSLQFHSKFPIITFLTLLEEQSPVLWKKNIYIYIFPAVILQQPKGVIKSEAKMGLYL